MATMFDPTPQLPAPSAAVLANQPDDDDTGAKPGSYIGPGESYTPREWLPTRGHLTYMRELFTVILLLLALPILFLMLLRSPGTFARKVATAAAT